MTAVSKRKWKKFLPRHPVWLFADIGGLKFKSNAESSDGYSYTSVEVEGRRICIVIELKYAENTAIDIGCKDALEQIYHKYYEEALVDDGMKTIYRYGIACFIKVAGCFKDDCTAGMGLR